jgi:sugar transferase (PEP-CTERM/EpsH1 system associated)
LKLFILLSRVPYPLEKGDKLRAFHFIKQLSKKNKIILCALNDKKLHPEAYNALNPYCEAIYFIKLTKLRIFFNLLRVFFNRLPLQVNYFYSRPITKKILKLIEMNKPDHLFCQLVRVAEYIKDSPIPKTIDYQDVFSKGVHRRMEKAAFYFKPFLYLEYRRLVRYEAKVFEYFNNKLIISFPDRDLIVHPKNEEITVIPNGVDTDYLKPQELPKEFDIVFTGNMGYPPNINSAEYLVKKILPIVHLTMPWVKLAIAGVNPANAVLNLRSDKVIVTGWVEDMRLYYAKSRIFIAPMQIGTGLQNKLLEAMAMKIPCITSELANSALKAKENEDILIGRSEEEYAAHIISLLSSREQVYKLTENAYAFILKNYNWDAIFEKLSDVIHN